MRHRAEQLPAFLIDTREVIVPRLVGVSAAIRLYYL
jgi:hypothetical protein